MIFLRPHIIRNARDGASVTLDRYNYMRSAQAAMPVEASWIMPDASQAELPPVERNAQTGLIDLRNDAPPPVPGVASDTGTVLRDSSGKPLAPGVPSAQPGRVQP